MVAILSLSISLACKQQGEGGQEYRKLRGVDKQTDYNFVGRLKVTVPPKLVGYPLNSKVGFFWRVARRVVPAPAPAPARNRASNKSGLADNSLAAPLWPSEAAEAQGNMWITSINQSTSQSRLQPVLTKHSTPSPFISTTPQAL